MYDATLHAIEQIKSNKILYEKMSYLPKKFALMTVHRAESTGHKEIFQKIVNYADKCSKAHGLKILFPVHPRTRHLIDQEKLGDNFVLLDPLSYFETQFCLSKASFVFTDSGGLQKEAYFHRVPCVTLRTETEWVETITHGWNRLCSVEAYQSRQEILEYGDGKCAEKILTILKNLISHEVCR